MDELVHKLAEINEAWKGTSLDIVRNEQKYNTEPEVDYGPLPVTMCNQGQLQVFSNILINAAQAMDNQGTISSAQRLTREIFFSRLNSVTQLSTDDQQGILHG